MNINLSPLKALKTPVLLTSIFVAALLAYYYFWVSGKATYLEGRNFRLLATAGRQIDESIDTQVQVIRSIVQAETPDDEKRRLLAARVTNLDQEDPIPFGQPCGDHAKRVYLEPDAGHNWVRVVFCTNGQSYGARFSLDKLLQEIFGETAKQMAFGSVLLAKTGGEVVYQSAPSAAASEQKLTRLDKLTPLGNAPSPPAFAALAHATNAFTAELSGTTHHLFLQPCCQSLLANAPHETAAKPPATFATTEASSATSNPPSSAPAIERRAASQGEGLVLCGLVSARRLTFSSWEISLTLLALITGIILAAIFSWPFLKLSLIGERQRVQLLDVLLVGACAVLLLALVTLTGLDWAAYYDLKAGLNRNLEELARQIKQEARDEVARNYAQLAELETQALAAHTTARSAITPPRYRASFAPYTELFLVDKEGQQFGKHPMIPGDLNPAINIRDREYFKQMTKERTWNAPALASAPDTGARPYVLESIRSWTSGQRRAVMIKPRAQATNEPLQAETAQPATARQAIAAGVGVRLRSLIGPVVPYGFGFAVIDDDGRVLFHADEQRNLIENFFAESDNDRRLRAAVAAHRAEHVQISYGGQKYAAFVSPLETLPGPSWHVVTFYDKQLPRTLNVEWLVTTVLLLSGYAMVFVLFGAAVFALRPHYRAPWLWPDQARLKRYLLLVALYLIPGALLGGIISSASVGRWPLVGVALALALVWGLTWAVLCPAPRSTVAEEPWWRTTWRSRSALISAYSAFWVAHLFLIAVLPTVIFFQIAHRVHSDSNLKHTQLRFALDLQQHRARVAEEMAQDAKQIDRWNRQQAVAAPSPKPTPYTVPATKAVAYDAGLLKLVPEVPPTQDANQPLLPWVIGLALPSLLEDSPFSVQLKEMGRSDEASDGLWEWRRGKEDPRQLFLRLRPEPQTTVEPISLQTTVPRLLTHGSFDDLLLLTATAIAIALMLLWIVRFGCQRIFLIDLMPPVWRDAQGRMQVSGGYHTFICCRDEAQANEYRTEVVVDFRDWPPADERRDWRILLGERMEGRPLGAPVVLDHFEVDIHNAYFNGQKLDVIEELIRVHNRTVIILTAAHPAAVFAYFQAPVMVGDTQLLGAHARRWETLSAFTVIDIDALHCAPPTPPTTPTHTASALPARTTTATTSEPIAPAALVPGDAGQLGRPPANGARHGMTQRLRQIFQQTGALVSSSGRLEREYQTGLLSRLRAEVAPHDRVESATNGSANGASHAARPLNRDVLEEVDDRAARYYYQLWSACTPAEKTVLVHLAQDGFLNEKDRRTIRRLMMRGFIVRGPHLRLESWSLRRFLLTRTCQIEAAKLAAAPRSDWDSFKWPFIVVLGAVVLFFFATQQELFNATVAVITGIAGSLPVVIRVIGVLLGKRAQNEEASK